MGLQLPYDKELPTQGVESLLFDRITRNPLLFLVEQRGIEPLTSKLPV